MAFIPSDKSFTAEGGSFRVARPNTWESKGIEVELVRGGPDVELPREVEAIDPEGGKFNVKADESITYMGGGPATYPAVGKVWTKAKDGAVYETMIGNLATGAGGQYRSGLNSVLGKSTVDSYVGTAEKSAGSVAEAAKAGDPTKGKGALSGTSIFDAWWFWPTVIVGSTVVIGGIVTYVVMQRREAAGEMVTKLRKRVGV